MPVPKMRALKTKKQIFKVLKYAETQCPLEGIPYRDLIENLKATMPCHKIPDWDLECDRIRDYLIPGIEMRE